MADEAAGAVRRTPRPARDELIEQAHDALRAEVIWDNQHGWSEPTVADREKIIAALDARGLLADHEQCQEINQDWQAYKQRKIAERRQLTAERDLAVWLHTEMRWQRDLARELLADVTERFDAERDALQARLDDGLAKIAKALKSGPYLDPDETRALLAVLQDDKPADACSGCWETGNDVEPEIGGVATVSVSGWPAGVPHVWLRVDSYAYKNEGADVVLQPDEADEIASFLRGAAQAVRKDRAEPTGEVDR